MTTGLLTRVARLERERPRTRPADGDVSLWTPLPGPQTDALNSTADILGYGGQAGGGKSLLEIGLAVTQHRRSIIFRREQDQVRDLWQKLSDVCGSFGRSNENLLIWRDLPGGRYVRLAGVKNRDDWKKYQGQGHDLYAFDEATEFLEHQVRTLIAWNRTTVPGQRCRVVLSFNPPTSPEGEWILQFFAPWLDNAHPNPAEPGELRWYAVVDGKDVEVEGPEPFAHKGETITPKSRTFIPARLSDNPYLEATGYRVTLQNLPEPLRSQLLYGDFTIGLQDDEWQVIPSAWVRDAQRRWHDGRADAPLTAVGADIAQGGADKTTFARRYGDWVAEPEQIPGSQVPDAGVNAQHVIRVLTEGGYAVIDIDGLGASTYYLLRPSLGMRVRPFAGSAPTDYQDRGKVLEFANTRAAAYWHLRDLLDPTSGRHIALPPGSQVLADLTAPRWFKSGDQVGLEKKKDIKARLGRSPDVGDAIVMAFWDDMSAIVAEAWAAESAGSVRPVTRDEESLPWNRPAEAERFVPWGARE